MNKSVLLIALLLVPLSGCLGIPEGAISHGDSIQATVTVRDADTGELILSQRPLDFQLGSGNSGLGFEFERQLIAKADDFFGNIVVRGDPSTQWSGTVDTQARFESDAVQQIPVAQFAQNFGTPSEGQIFTPQFSFFPYKVLAVNGDMVSYTAMPEQGQRDPLPHIGASLRTSIEGDLLVQIVEPDVGATFRILPPSPFNPTTPLGLQPGSYQVLGGDGETISFRHSQATNPDVVGHDLDVTVRVTNVRASPGSSLVEPVDGNYGVRTSTYINGAPALNKDFGALSNAVPAEPDHGHDH